MRHGANDRRALVRSWLRSRGRVVPPQGRRDAQHSALRCAGDRSPNAGHRRNHTASHITRARPQAPRHHAHGAQHGGDGGGGHGARSVPLSHQTVSTRPALSIDRAVPRGPALMRERVSASAIFRLASFYGVAGFGGGYSVLAQMRRDLVERRKWLTGDEFLVLAELSKSLPGTRRRLFSRSSVSGFRVSAASCSPLRRFYSRVRFSWWSARPPTHSCAPRPASPSSSMG